MVCSLYYTIQTMDLICNDVKAQNADSVDTFVQRVLREIAVRYVNVCILQQGVKCTDLITRQMCVVLHQYQNLSLVSSGETVSHCHITLTSILPLLFNSPMS